MSKFILFWFLSSVICYASGFQRYFNDTYQCLEGMRNKTSGLLRDSVTADLKTLHDPTSPSNMALDLLVQVEALGLKEFSQRGHVNIHKILATLQRIPFHAESGMFYNRYSSDGKLVKEWYLSAVDNIHLAYALWVVSKVETDQKNLAASLFTRFKFNYLYNPATGLYFGGAYLQNDQWMLEAWKYDYLGSEGRSLYSLSYALGLNQELQFLQKLKLSLILEIKDGNMLLWDGGAFQLLLPELLISESSYSQKLKKYFLNYAQDAITLGAKRNYPVPANHSASQFSIDLYNGKAGSKELVSSMNTDINDPALSLKWDVIFTPHAAFLAATINPAAYEVSLKRAEGLGKETKLYTQGIGWLDGYHVKGEFQGEVVPVFLALDQAMIALASAKHISRDGQLTGPRLLQNNTSQKLLLKKYYSKIFE